MTVNKITQTYSLDDKSVTVKNNHIVIDTDVFNSTFNISTSGTGTTVLLRPLAEALVGKVEYNGDGSATVTMPGNKTPITYTNKIVNGRMQIGAGTFYSDFGIGTSGSINISSNLSQGEFVAAVYKAGTVDEATTKVPAAITTAQAILESNYGKSVPTDINTGQYSYNLFGH